MQIHLKKLTVPVLVFILGSLISFLLWQETTSAVESDRAVQFKTQSDEVTSLIQSSMDQYTAAVYGAQGLFAASNSVEKSEWDAYVEKLNLTKNYAGISGMSFIKRVKKADLAKYPYKIYPEADKDEYFPFTYSFSVVSTTSNPGFDASSEPKRAATLVEAAKSGSAEATPLVYAVTTGIPTFSVYAPIYANGQSVNTEDEKQQALTGFVVASFRVQRLFEGLANNPLFTKDIQVEIYDATNISKLATSSLLFNTGTEASGTMEPVLGPFSRATSVVVAGRTWTLYFSGVNGYRSGNLAGLTPFITLFVGIAISLFIAWLIYFYSQAGARAEAITARIKKDLEKTQENYQNIFNSLQDVLYRTDAEGKITLVSPSIEKYTGLPAKDVIGRNAMEFYPDTAERGAMLQTLKEKGSVSDYPLSLFGKDKTPIQVSLNAHVILDENGTYLGTEGLLRDVTVRKSGEDELKRLNSLMIGRELKMAELKKQIQALGGTVEPERA